MMSLICSLLLIDRPCCGPPASPCPCSSPSLPASPLQSAAPSQSTGHHPPAAQHDRMPLLQMGAASSGALGTPGVNAKNRWHQASRSPEKSNLWKIWAEPGRQTTAAEALKNPAGAQVNPAGGCRARSVDEVRGARGREGARVRACV
uniref:Uncharacterized protein n=1 Tax=Arundo donax TaxID=35708 RepID=A0A0A8YL70_ARUDO